MAGTALTRMRAGWVIPLALGIVVIFLPALGLGFSVTRQIELSLILALIVSGLNISLGYAGELALGQAAMYAAGAYTAGLLSVVGHTDLILQLVAGGLVALAVGLLSGIPGLRVGSWSLAMTSFFLVLVLPDVIAILKDFTGGRNGLSGIESPTVFDTVLDGDSFYIAIAVVTICWFAVMRNIAVSRHGTALRVLKQSPVLASSIGISVYRMKLLAYAVGSIPAGLAGVLFANLDLYIAPDSFGFTLAITVLAASILGGTASVYGAAIGAAVLQFGLNEFGDLQHYKLVATGAFLIIGGVLFTGGLAGLGHLAAGRMRRRRDRRAPAKNPAPDTSVEISIAGRRLEVDSVSKAFGGNQALSSVSLVAEAGRVTALIGPNGSGKTTLLNMIGGFYRTDEGHVSLDRRTLDGHTPHRVARDGVARTFQTPNIPAGLTVLEAVAAGRYAFRRATMIEAVLRLPRYRRVRREDLAEAHRMIALVGLTDLESMRADALPLGQRRLLEVARCLVSNPAILLLDEVASGLDEDEVERLAVLIRQVRDSGGTVLLVEHNFQLVMSLADEIYVLAQGSLLARGTPAEIENHPDVMSEYLGIQVVDASAAPPDAPESATEEDPR